MREKICLGCGTLLGPLWPEARCAYCPPVSSEVKINLDNHQLQTRLAKAERLLQELNNWIERSARLQFHEKGKHFQARIKSFMEGGE